MSIEVYYAVVVAIVLSFAAVIPILWLVRAKRKTYELQILAKIAGASLADADELPLLIVLMGPSDRPLDLYREYASAYKLPVVYLYAAPAWMVEMKSRVWGVGLIAVSEEIVTLFAPGKTFLLERRAKDISLKKLNIV